MYGHNHDHEREAVLGEVTQHFSDLAALHCDVGFSPQEVAIAMVAVVRKMLAHELLPDRREPIVDVLCGQLRQCLDDPPRPRLIQ